MLKSKISLLIVSLTLLMSGCATVSNVPLKEQFWKMPSQKVTVTLAKLPTPRFYSEGSQGLLDIAIADASNSSLNKYLSGYDLNALTHFKFQFVQELNAHKIRALSSSKPIDIEALDKYSGDENAQYAEKNFISIANQFETDKLLVISVNAIGASRSYYGFIPLGGPSALCVLKGQLINLHTNEVLWRYISTVKQNVGENWDQPPSYPSVKSALSRAISVAKDELMRDFFSSSKT